MRYGVALVLVASGCVQVARVPPAPAPVRTGAAAPGGTGSGTSATPGPGNDADTARLQVREQPYRIAGRTAGELSAALERQRPTLGGFLGRTSWRIQFTAQPVRDGTGCRLDAVVVAVDATVEVPQWTAPADSDGALQAQWTRFSRALRAHEGQHVEHARLAGAAALRELRALRAACDAIGTSATGIGQRITTEFQARDRELDARTRNGATDGAVWPSSAAPR